MKVDLKLKMGNLNLLRILLIAEVDFDIFLQMDVSFYNHEWMALH